MDSPLCKVSSFGSLLSTVISSGRLPVDEEREPTSPAMTEEGVKRLSTPTGGRTSYVSYQGFREREPGKGHRLHSDLNWYLTSSGRPPTWSCRQQRNPSPPWWTTTE